MLVAVSCNKETKEDDSNSLVGTIWVYHYSSSDTKENMIIEFTSKSTVSSYTVDQNFIATKEATTGSYVINDDGSITFTNFKGYYEAWWYDIKRAEKPTTQTMKVWALSRFALSDKWSEKEQSLTFGKKNN